LTDSLRALAWLLALPLHDALAGEVEMLHWWTSPGEQAAFAVVTTQLQGAGVELKNAAILGGGGNSAMEVLQARAIAGNPPALAQLEGQAIASWTLLGFIQPQDEVAGEQEWDRQLLGVAPRVNKIGGHYMGIPVNVHRLNWMWVNRALLARLDMDPPTDWPGFLDAVRALRAKGIKPLALGNDPWQVALLFESLALGMGGKEYYQKAFVELDPVALGSDTSRQILDRFRELSELVLPTLSGQSWDQATADLAEGRAAFQLMGDWVLGDLLARGVAVPEQVQCLPAPGTQGLYVYNMDSFVMFNANLPKDHLGIARALASPDFQLAFNRAKGSIPVRRDLSLTDFNPCAQLSRIDYDRAEAAGNLMPSVADSMALHPLYQKAVESELYRFFNQPDLDREGVIRRLGAVARSASSKG
jgi:glucose/mannose transport system substrate-binding protein